MNLEKLEAYEKASKIAKQTVEYAKKIIKPNMLLLDIAEKIEDKIVESGGKPAFPVNLSINDIAAHYSPTSADKLKASGLLKVDIGVHFSGYIVDTAFTLDLENKEENKKLIKAAEKALEKAVKIIKPEIEIWKIGQTIQETISSFSLTTVRNLSGHELSQYNIHAGLIIPNYNNENKNKLPEGVYAIEPFSTTGLGEVYEGKESGIYKLKEKKPVRDKKAREILSYIETNYSTLPFCERWIEKKFPSSKLQLKFLEQQGILHQYPALIEKSHAKVAQAEHTVIVSKDKVEVLT